jgi:hypothetical protein
MTAGMLKDLQEQSRWLLRCASDVTSQCGEDGILSRALDLLPERNSWCIEFGAWDGRKASNTCNLIASRGYRGVLIELDPVRFRELERTYGSDKHILLNATVGFDECDSLEALLRPYSQVPRDVDVLSIDIDGNDYHVWATIRDLRAKLVVVEFNHTIANCVHFVQEKRMGVTQGASAKALVELGRAKKYELIAVTRWNLIFVDSRYYELFRIPDNSLEVMRDDSDVPQIFVGYDGTTFLSQSGILGSIAVNWHPPVRLFGFEAQGLPAFLRKYPDNYSATQRILFQAYWRLRRLKQVFQGSLGRLQKS